MARKAATTKADTAAATPAVKKAACTRKARKTENTTAKAVCKKCAPKMESVVLTLQAEPGSTVCLAGSFNNWDPSATVMVDKDGTGLFSVSIPLPPGIYEYKFVVNGEWQLDPDPDRDWTQNGLGTLNSVLRVG